MEEWETVSHDQWRACATGAFLIDYVGGHISRMRFDASGRLTDFGMDRDALEVLVDSGKPFQISGCPGHDNEISACNRSYGGGYSLIPVCPQCQRRGRWCVGRWGGTMEYL
jgi:biotin synthase